MACLEELPGQRLQEKKPTNKVFYHSLGLQSCIWKKQQQNVCNNIFLTDEIKVEMFAKTKQSVSAQTAQTNFQSRWWKGDAFWFVMQLGTLQSLSRPQIPQYTKVFSR